MIYASANTICLVVVISLISLAAGTIQLTNAASVSSNSTSTTCMNDNPCVTTVCINNEPCRTITSNSTDQNDASSIHRNLLTPQEII
jgi:hypothetical protein